MVWVLAAGLTAARVVVGGVHVSAAGTAIPTCTVTGIRMVNEPTTAEPGVALLAAGGFSGCFGSYVFNGITAVGLWFPNFTTNNYLELAAALKHWSPRADGGLAVSQWVSLSPSVAASMQKAGVNPTMFLQWVNEYNASAWAGTGVRIIHGTPPVWPTWLPKAYVSDPATIAGGTADQAIQAPKPTPPPDAALQQPVTPTRALTPPAASPSRTVPAATRGGAVKTSQRAQGSSTALTTASKPQAPVAKSPTPVTVPTLTPVAPPAVVVTTGHVTVPCVVATTCRQAVVAHDRWRSTPWYRRVGLDVWWYRWWEIASLAIVAAATLGGRAIIIGRRNLAWYGNGRGPR